MYRARRFGRFWVLKTTASPGCDTALRAALCKEFEVSMMLPRMCAANAYSLEEVEGVGTCIVMDYLEGPTLRRWLDDEPPLTERRRMARSIVEAVGRVHQAGVVHRDIKPENIIVSSLGHAPLLIDFGLADTTSHTDFKAPAGTLSYISPEQMGGNRPDIRNDIYSLGCLLRAIIAEGERAVDEVWRATGLMYLDTVNPAGFVANIYSSAPMDAEATRFIASRPDLSPEETLLVTDALNRRIKANVDLWIKRRSMMQPEF